MQHVHIFADSRAAESDGLVLQEILEKLWHFISPTNLEDQILGRHRELKDGDALIISTLATVSELAVQAHTLDWCDVEEIPLDSVDPPSTLDARRVTVILKCNSSAVR
jgi:hypothetical protein